MPSRPRSPTTRSTRPSTAPDGYRAISLSDISPDALTRSGLPRRALPGPAPHSQGTQEKGTEEHDNADDQQVKQALDDDTHDAEHDRHDHEEEEEGQHLMLRSVGLVSGGPVVVHRWRLADTSGRSA